MSKYDDNIAAFGSALTNVTDGSLALSGATAQTGVALVNAILSAEQDGLGGIEPNHDLYPEGPMVTREDLATFATSGSKGAYSATTGILLTLLSHSKKAFDTRDKCLEMKARVKKLDIFASARLHGEVEALEKARNAAARTLKDAAKLATVLLSDDAFDLSTLRSHKRAPIVDQIVIDPSTGKKRTVTRSLSTQDVKALLSSGDTQDQGVGDLEKVRKTVRNALGALSRVTVTPTSVQNDPALMQELEKLRDQISKLLPDNAVELQKVG